MSNAREYYDRTSEGYVSKWREIDRKPENPAFYFRRRLIEGLLDLAAIREGERVVEMGCGTGLVLKEALKRTRPVFGTDISIEMLRRVQDSVLADRRVEIVSGFSGVPRGPAGIRGGADAYLMVDDIRNPSLPAGLFDVVLSLEVLRYVESLDSCLARVRSVLAPGSRFVFSATNLWSASLFPLRFSLRRRLGLVKPDRELLQYFVTEGSLRSRLRRAGFEVTGFRRARLASINPLFSPLIRTSAAARRIETAEDALSRVPIVRGLFDTFLVAARPC
ncbi:MAG: methyltransferase domain-containing protein [Planctomycetes bacterium]|nr:methyltransferase domain-containing protein [Planctomycetota bacterium]